MKYFYFLAFLLLPLNTWAISLIPSIDDDKWGYLGEKFQTGDLALYDIPAYLMYLIENSVAVAGVLAVIFVMVGGYAYLIGAFNDSPDEGKKYITNVVWGLGLVLSAWLIIDLIIIFLTS